MKTVQIESSTLILADNREALPGFVNGERCTAVVSDPPYGIEFMGRKDWDSCVPGPHFWQLIAAACLPGAPLLAFGGTRTFHRLVCAIEDAGWEVRDTLMWLHGQGFPKSLDISKAIDKRGGASVSWFGPWFREWREQNGVAQKQVAALFPSKTGGLTGCVANWELGFNMPTPEQFNLIRDTFGLPFDSIEEAEREVVGKGTSGKTAIWQERGTMGNFDITAPATDAAKLWHGYGSALKPAFEPICLAMNPLEGTFAENALKYSVAGLNIDGCRIPANHLTGQRLSSSLAAWEQEKNLCASCAALAADRTKQETPATRASTATSNAEPTTNEKAATIQDDTDKKITGCSAGLNPAELATGQTENLSLSMCESGKKRTEKSRKAGASTTSITTDSTTASKICASCGSAITQDTILQNTPAEPNASPKKQGAQGFAAPSGRWPSNCLHDGSAEVLAGFPVTTSGKMSAGQQRNRSKGGGGYHGNFPDEATAADTYGDTGSAARFFYCAKASRSEREAGCEGLEERKHHSTNRTDVVVCLCGNKSLSSWPICPKCGEDMRNGTTEQRNGLKARNHHPTVKPLALMQYLVRLVTMPAHNRILDPFMGSGTTGVACAMAGVPFVGIEMNPDYFEIACRRIEHAHRSRTLTTPELLPA